MVDDLSAENQYLFSLTLSLCWEADGSNCTEHIIFNNALVPKVNCIWNQPYKLKGSNV